MRRQPHLGASPSSRKLKFGRWTAKLVVVVDESKIVKQLGVGVVPVEILPFLWRSAWRRSPPASRYEVGKRRPTSPTTGT